MREWWTIFCAGMWLFLLPVLMAFIVIYVVLLDYHPEWPQE